MDAFILGVNKGRLAAVYDIQSPVTPTHEEEEEKRAREKDVVGTDGVNNLEEAYHVAVASAVDGREEKVAEEGGGEEIVEIVVDPGDDDVPRQPEGKEGIATHAAVTRTRSRQIPPSPLLLSSSTSFRGHAPSSPLSSSPSLHPHLSRSLTSSPPSPTLHTPTVPPSPFLSPYRVNKTGNRKIMIDYTEPLLEWTIMFSVGTTGRVLMEVLESIDTHGKTCETLFLNCCSSAS